MIDRAGWDGAILIYDDEPLAEEEAKRLGREVRHARVKKNAHHKTFSVILHPDRKFLGHRTAEESQ